ncbi:hypothetical protein BT93_F0898 [Corymbia citriodora subsp. variegata]|nr:hypothetical protein BT93_F0898 [Corymbia citriodora subsp. variegata]
MELGIVILNFSLAHGRRGGRRKFNPRNYNASNALEDPEIFKDIADPSSFERNDTFDVVQTEVMDGVRVKKNSPSPVDSVKIS